MVRPTLVAVIPQFPSRWTSRVLGFAATIRGGIAGFQTPGPRNRKKHAAQTRERGN
jgi:hypothetical protein